MQLCARRPTCRALKLGSHGEVTGYYGAPRLFLLLPHTLPHEAQWLMYSRQVVLAQVKDVLNFSQTQNNYQT